MKKTILALSTLALSLGLALSPLSATAAETPSATTARQVSSLALVLGKVMPSVVSINVEGSMTVNTPRMPHNFQQLFGDDSPFYQEGSPLQSSPFCQGSLGGNGGNQQQKSMTLSSGVITGADKGYAVVNNHVIDNATMIKVQLSDGRKLGTKMIGRNPRFDTVLIRIQSPKNLTTVKMADSDALRVGDYTVAIGNPFGLGETVTPGIVSALGHNGLDVEDCENLIQTGTVINRGNSGGALASLSGELIGINTAILASDGGNIDISLAIPSNMVENLTSQTVEYGQVKRGGLDIMGAELSSDLAEAVKTDTQRGAFVSQALPNPFTAKAGIKAGDVITLLNGKPISSFAALRAQVSTMLVGSKLTLGLLRDGKQVSVNLELQQSSQNQADSSTIFNGTEGTKISSGGKDQGMVVNNVRTSTSAAQIDLKKGNVITGANQQAVKNITELREALDNELSVLALNIQHSDSIIHLLMQ